MATEPLLDFKDNALSTQSSRNDIKAYFEGVLKLYQSAERFPVNLEEVWPLVYSAKDKAVRALKRDFYEDMDYITVARNGEGGRFGSVDYYLSVNCMEYLIARKVRSVFEVYREVFHKVASGEVAIQPKAMSELEILAKSAQALLEQSKRIEKVEARLNDMEREREVNKQRLLTEERASETMPQKAINAKIRRLVNNFAESHNIGFDVVWTKVYRELEDRYHQRPRRCKLIHGDRSWLDVAVRKGYGQNMLIIASNLDNLFHLNN